MTVTTGKTLILTGASRGIGRALAVELARSGTHLVLNATSATPLLETAEECADNGAKVAVVAGDSSDDSMAREMVDKALELGDFYGFIHAAGVLSPGKFIWELGPGEAEKVMNASFGGAAALIRAAVPVLLEKGEGLAVFFGSGAAEMHVAGIGIYCAAKAAEEHLAGQLAVEAPGIVSFIYRPGVVETRMQEQARNAEGGAAKSLRPIFQEWKNSGALLTPQQAAESLVNILKNPRKHHGRIARVEDGL